jgi:hypothetical protein
MAVLRYAAISVIEQSCFSGSTSCRRDAGQAVATSAALRQLAATDDEVAQASTNHSADLPSLVSPERISGLLA